MDLKLKLADVTKQLQRYQSVYGDSTSHSADVKSLTKQLHVKEDEIQKLRLLDQQREQVRYVMMFVECVYLYVPPCQV